MTPTQARVLAKIRGSWPHAVTKAMFKPLTPRTVDSAVRELRLAGYPIASTPEGYWVTTKPHELRDTASGLLRRMGHIAETYDALQKTAADMELAGLGAERPSLWEVPA
jgi:hypothetical protein